MIGSGYLKQKPHLFASMPLLLCLNNLKSELGPNLKISVYLTELYLRGYSRIKEHGLFFFSPKNLASAFSFYHFSLRNLGPVDTLSGSQFPYLWNGENNTYFVSYFESQM